MKLSQALRPECVAAGAAPTDKAAALAAVAELAKACPALAGVPVSDILEGLTRREALGSTGFGGGMAIPHCRLPAVGEFVVGLLAVPGGVDFAAMDGKPVRLIAFIVGSEKDSDRHIHLLSAISRVLSAPAAVDQLAVSADAAALREAFLADARDELVPATEGGWSLVQIIVRDEDLFSDLLTVFGGIRTGGVTVLPAESSEQYLARIPLFADVWRGDAERFGRIILALVARQIANETVRRIEGITGPLDERNDVLVVVQDVFYAAGSLGG